MMPLGHIVSGLGVVQLGHRVFPRLNKVDWRFVTIAPLVPDLIDKPLAILISFSNFTQVQSTRLVAHTLLFSLLLLAIGFFLRRDWLPYSLAFSTHLITDRMWETPATLFWPIFGWTTSFTRRFLHIQESVGHSQEQDMMEHLLILLIELGALAVLTWLVQRHQLWRWRNLKRFLRTGQLTSVRQISSLQPLC